MEDQELSQVHIDPDGDLVYVSVNFLDKSTLETHIQGLLYEDMWWFYIKDKRK